jgi:lysophospholipase L1-like esterase
MKNPRCKFIKQLAYSGILASPLSTLITSCNSDHKLKTKKGMVFLFQGDSITDSNRGRDNDPNHIMGHGYALAIAAQLGVEYPLMDLRFYNRGISGNTIVEMANRWQRDTLDLKPDLLSILIGVNDSSSVIFDWGLPVTIHRYEEIFDSLLTKTLAKYPDMLLVLCEPFILKVGIVAENWQACQSDIEKRQEIVRKLADRYDAIFIGYQEMFNEASKNAPAGYWIWDGVHPTIAGHELMAKEWLKQVKKKLSFDSK